jgi:predicted lipase
MAGIIITKDTFKRCIKASINTYNGEYGKVDDSIFEVTDKFKKDHVEGLWGVKEGILYIVFQGSHGLKDWLDNFKFKLVRLKSYLKAKKTIPYANMNSDIEVHDGFVKQYHTIREDVHKILAEHIGKGIKEVIGVGHSLGAAIAQLMILDFQYNYRANNHFGIMLEDIACINFGSPRVGNKNFVKSYNGRVPKSFRFVFEQDMVPTVPFASFGFSHTDTLMKIHKKKSIWQKILRSYRYITRSTDNHYPDQYEIGIEECIPEDFKI